MPRNLLHFSNVLVSRPENRQCTVSKYGCTVYAAFIEGDLRVIFCIEGDRLVSMDIGSHDLYGG